MSISVCNECETVVEGRTKQVAAFPYDPDPVSVCPYCGEPVAEVNEDRDELNEQHNWAQSLEE